MSPGSFLADYAAALSLALLAVVWASLAYGYTGSGSLYPLAALAMCLLSLGGAAHELWQKRGA